MGEPDLLRIELAGRTFEVEFLNGYATKVTPMEKWMEGNSKQYIADRVKLKGGSMRYIYPETTERKR